MCPSTAFNQKMLFMSRTGRMNCWWERKCLAPMLVMQLIGCNGKLKATNIFLSWLLLCGNIRLTFSILELHSCSVKKRQDTFRLLGRCTPPSSGVVEWHWRKVKSPLLLTCTFPLHPLKCTTNSEATHSPSQKNVPSHTSTPGKAQLKTEEVQQLLPHKKMPGQKADAHLLSPCSL